MGAARGANEAGGKAGAGEPRAWGRGRGSTDKGRTAINRTIIRCNCGHRIFRRDVIQTGLYLSGTGPSYVYVRFRCGRCKRVGEQLVQEGNWDPTVLQRSEVRLDEATLARFAAMGEITPEEVVDFHYAVRRLGAELDDVGEPA